MLISEPPLSFKPAAVLRALGPDSLTFLQGQFTQDLRPVGIGQVTYGLWLNQKGKVMGDSHALRVGSDEWLLISEFTPAVELRARLDAYLIADEVELRDETALWQLTVHPGRGRATEAGAVAPLRGDAVEGWRWVNQATLTGGLHLHPAPAGAGDSSWLPYRLARLQAHLPSVGLDLGETDLPQEGGLEVFGVSFQKGCYLGQEVMARLHSMGQVRRGWQVVRGRGPVPPTPADLLDAEGKRVGELRSACAHGDVWLGAAMLLHTALASATVWSCAKSDGPIQLDR